MRAKRGTAWPRQLPNGRWQAQTSRTEGGRRTRETRSFDLKTDADWWLAQAKRGHLPDADLTVSEYLDRWLRGKRDIRESTRGLYRSHIEQHLKPELGGFELLALRRRHVEAFVDGLSVGPSTAGSILRTLRMSLADGVRKHDLPENPAAYVKPPRVEREPVAAMTAQDAATVIEAVRGTWVEYVTRFLLGSGCRIGEACGLDQGDVSVQSSPEIERFVRIRRAKTVPRATPISKDAQMALAQALKEAPRRGPHEPVFFGPRSGDRIKRDVASQTIKRLTGYSAHALRHLVATVMVAQGIPMRVVADQLGHKDPGVTARVYAHVTPESRQEAVGVLDRMVRKSS